MSAVPQLQITATGIVVPAAPAVLAGVQADINAAFGGNLNPALTTPQGQMASTQAAIINNNNAMFAQFVALIDPDNSSGFMQDAIARIYFLTRNPGLPTVVQCTCAGADGTIIPIGTLAQDTSQNLYICQATGTISGGVVSLPFANVVNGPIPCPSSTLTTIYQAISGWESISNPSAGVLGANVETAQAFEFRRAQSVALNSHGPVDAIYANVFQVPGVIDVYAYENVLSTSITVGSSSYTMVPNSIYVGVSGGVSTAIAQAIWNKKSPGCNYNGDTSVTVTDSTGYNLPYPTYTVKFHYLTNTPILFSVNIANNPQLPSNIIALVQNAIIAAFTGADGGTRARAGSLISSGRYYAGVIATNSNVSCESILLGPSTPTLTSYLMGIDQEPTISASNIAVNLV